MRASLDYFQYRQLEMSQDNPSPKQPNIYNPQHDLLYPPMQEDIVVNRWRLQTLLEERERTQKRRRLEDSFPWIGVLLAFMLPLVTSDFKPFLAISGETWKAIFVIGAAYSGFKTIQVWWTMFRQGKENTQTPAEIVQALVDEMKTQRAEYLQEPAPLHSPGLEGTISVAIEPSTQSSQSSS